MRFLRFVIVLVCALQAQSALAGVADQDWHEVRSDNFQIFTNGNVDEVKTLARELEFFRGVVIAMAGSQNMNSSIPFRIFAVSNRGDFKQFFSQFMVVGVFTPSVRGHYAIIDLSAKTVDRKGKPVRGADVYLKHEYVHYILRGGSRVRYPYWYEEGFAEYLSTLEYENGDVRVGYPVVSRHMSLNQEFGMAGVERLLTSTRLDRTISTDTLYAQGWLLVHHLHSQPGLAPRIMEYLTRYNQTGDSLTAFNEVFQMDLGALNRELAKTARRGNYTYSSFRLKESLPEPAVTTRALTQDETRLHLAEVLAHFRGRNKDFKEVTGFYRDVLARDPANRDALAGLATLALETADVRGAAALLASIPHDALDVPVLIARGRLAYASAMEAAATRADAAPDGIGTARDYFLDALRQNPKAAEAFFYYGLTYLGSTEAPREGLMAFREAALLVPSDSSIGAYHALMQLQAGEFEAARVLAERMESEGGDKQLAEFCRRIAAAARDQSAAAGRALADEHLKELLSGKPEEE
jgi:hypothetical protein